MGLVAPLALAALAAVLLPLWLHRREVPSNDRQRFPSAQFLDASPRPSQVVKEWQYLALLALRTLLLAAIAFAFAKPYLERDASAEPFAADAVHVLFIDTSLSMQRGGTMAAARRASERIVAAIPSSDAVFAARLTNRGVEIDAAPLTGTEQREFIDSQTAGVLRLDYADLARALQQFAERYSATPVTAYVVSDLQQSGIPARFADMVPAAPLSLVIERVESAADNARVAALRDTGSELVVELAVDTNAALAGRSLSVQVNDAPPLTVPIDSTATAIPMANLGLDNAENSVAVTVTGDDAIAGDNTRYAIVDRSPPSDVFLVSADTDGASELYLSAAFAAGADFRLVAATPNAFDRRELGRQTWLIVDDPAALPTDLVAAIGDFVSAGGSALVIGGEATLASGDWVLPARRAVGAGSSERLFASVGNIATEHPALGDAAPWGAVRVARYIPVELNSADQALVSLDTGDPLVFESTIDDGRVIVITTPLERDWSDLAQRAVFVGFVLDTARALAGGSDLERQFAVADVLPLNFAAAGSGEVIAPDGSERVRTGTLTSGGRVLLDIPGFYEVYTESRRWRIAANPDARESDPTTMTTALEERWKNAVVATTNAESPGAAVAADNDPDAEPLWPWLLAVVAGLLLAEQLLSNWFIGRQPDGSRHA
ncbi:MAG: BatA domain-containing protein [Pseudomonadota bacterium]